MRNTGQQQTIHFLSFPTSCVVVHLIKHVVPIVISHPTHTYHHPPPNPFTTLSKDNKLFGIESSDQC